MPLRHTQYDIISNDVLEIQLSHTRLCLLEHSINEDAVIITFAQSDFKYRCPFYGQNRKDGGLV